VKNENTKEDDWKYVGNYWEDNFEAVRDIFFGEEENLEKKWFCLWRNKKIVNYQQKTYLKNSEKPKKRTTEIAFIKKFMRVNEIYAKEWKKQGFFSKH